MYKHLLSLATKCSKNAAYDDCDRLVGLTGIQLAPKTDEIRILCRYTRVLSLVWIVRVRSSPGVCLARDARLLHAYVSMLTRITRNLILTGCWRSSVTGRATAPPPRGALATQKSAVSVRACARTHTHT